MGKTKDESKKSFDSPSSLKNEVEAAFGKGGDGVAWIREDGAVCIGDGCVVIDRNKTTGQLDMDIKPDKCGSAVGEVILDHLIRTAGKGVNIRIPPIEDKPK